MTDKEKKAIELLNKYTDRNFPCDSCKYCSERPNVNYSIKILLNLIEKQQKEIQRLIEIEKEHKKENGELREQVTHWKGKYHLENRRYLDLYDKKISTPKINATEEMLQQYIEKSKILEILNKYKYTELGNDEEIINFYKELQELLEERN